MVQFSNDGDYLYSAGQDGQIRYWRLASDEYLRSVVRNGWGISVFAIDETKDIVAWIIGWGDELPACQTRLC